jgi:tRNA A-37 threonylcarbamoyl transferase component Bud32
MGSDDTLRLRPPQGAAGPASLDDEIAPGARVGEYVVERLLAAGGQGAVYVATHRVLGRRAAVKVLRRELAASHEMTVRFVREARLVNLIRHPDIVDIYDIGTLPDGRPFCVMELLSGRSLAALLAERAPLHPAQAVALLAPVCGALQAVHEAGVVHRDVKASNVFVEAEGDAPKVKLLDFGVAKVQEPEAIGLTTAGQRMGTALAMAPEQIRGEAVDPRTDVYALGVLLHQMLTGRYPFSAADGAELERLHLEAVPPRPSALAPVPPALDGVVARALEKAPSQRWPSAAALLAATLAALDGARPAARLGHAVAIHVALRTAGGRGEAALEELADDTDTAEGALRAAGFAVPLAVAGAVLGVRPLPDVGADAARAAAVTLGRALHAQLARAGRPVAVTVHSGEALVTASGQVCGGPLCETSAWVTPGAAGFFATPAVLRPG